MKKICARVNDKIAKLWEEEKQKWQEMTKRKIGNAEFLEALLGGWILLEKTKEED